MERVASTANLWNDSETEVAVGLVEVSQNSSRFPSDEINSTQLRTQLRSNMPEPDFASGSAI